MIMQWLPRSLFRRSEPRSRRPSSTKCLRPSRRPFLEALEDRLVPSNIVWTNRGQASDNFGSTFASTGNASVARNVVDAAITSWQRVITNFHQLFGGNLINIDISMASSGAGDLGAAASVTGYDLVLGGHPTSGS